MADARPGSGGSHIQKPGTPTLENDAQYEVDYGEHEAENQGPPEPSHQKTGDDGARQHDEQGIDDQDKLPIQEFFCENAESFHSKFLHLRECLGRVKLQGELELDHQPDLN